MPDTEEIGAQRWHAVVDDMSALGSWCVMNVPKTPVAADPLAGELQIARYLTRSEAEQMVDLHNAALTGRPWTRPERYRVRAEDARIFDELGEVLTRADSLLGDASHTPPAHPLTEIRHLRGVLSEVLGALNLLTETTIRLRAQAQPGR